MILMCVRGSNSGGGGGGGGGDDDDKLQTKYYATKTLQTERDNKCRLCHQFEETVDHIISACPILAKNTSNDMIECALNYTSIYVRK
jgi:hypothetical protein